MSNFLQYLPGFQPPKVEEVAKPVRVVSIGDMHCGNITGLTPHQYNPYYQAGSRLYEFRKTLFNWYVDEMKALQPIDLLVVDGDAIDGKGPKTGGIEQLTMDRNLQVAMAAECIRVACAKRIMMTFGTGYHTGPDDDWEVEIAAMVGADIEDVVTEEVNGLRMKWRHHITGGISPVGKATSLLTQQVLDILWSTDGEFEKADVLLFAHRHDFIAVKNRYGLVMVQPSLQGLGGSSLGSRRMGGVVDYGFVSFDIKNKEEYTWKAHLLKQLPSIRNPQVEG